MNIDKLKNIFKTKNNRIKLIVIIGMIGILLIFVSDCVPSSNNDNKTENGEYTYNWEEYQKTLEDNLTDTISSIEGVGNCKVMITLDTTNEYVYAKNSKSSADNESENESSNSYEENYAIYELENGDNPLLIKQYFPKVKGVVVVCDGGADIYVKSSIIESVSALFDISKNKISVSKISSEE